MAIVGIINFHSKTKELIFFMKIDKKPYRSIKIDHKITVKKTLTKYKPIITLKLLKLPVNKA